MKVRMIQALKNGVPSVVLFSLETNAAPHILVHTEDACPQEALMSKYPVPSGRREVVHQVAIIPMRPYRKRR